MNQKKIIAITPFSTKVFNSSQEVMEAYDLSYFKLNYLIETGMLLEDGKTTFDEFLDPDEQEQKKTTGRMHVVPSAGRHKHKG